MFRGPARIDANHKEIVQALRAVGCSVQSLASIGKGCPDLLVGRGGKNWLLEVKDGAKKPSARRLTEDEAAWHLHWRGTVTVVETVKQALELVGVLQPASDAGRAA